MGLYVLLHAALVGFFAFAAIYHFSLWCWTRQDRLSAIFSADCLLRSALTAEMVRIALATNPDEASAAVSLQLAGLLLLPVTWIWSLTLFSGIRTRTLLWPITYLLGGLCCLQLFVLRLNAPVLAVDPVTLPWGEIIFRPKFAAPGWWLVPLYGLIIAVQAAGLQCGRQVWRRDRLAGGLILASGAITLALHAAVGLQGSAAGTWLGWGAIDHVVWVTVLSLLIAREQRRTREQLAVSEDRFRTLSEEASDGIFIVDANGDVLDVNSAGCVLTGYRREELQRLSVIDLVGAAEEDRVAFEIARLHDGNPSRSEWRIRRKDGGVVECEVHARQMSDRRILSVVRDITERKQAEQSLRLSEQRFARFMQNLPGLAWIKDSEGRYVYANEAAIQAFCTTRDRLYGKRDDELFPAETAAQFQTADRQALALSTGVQTIETLRHADGVVHFSLVNKFTLPDLDGNALLVGGIAIDITERRQAENELLENRQYLRSIAEATPHWIYVFDLDEMGVPYTNRSLLRDLGYPPGCEAAERSVKQFAGYMPPEELPHLASLLDAWPKMADGELRDDEYHLRHADGSIRSFASREIVFSRRPDGSVRQILGTLTDITRQKKAEESLRQSESMLAEAHRIGRLGSWSIDLIKQEAVWSDEGYQLLGFVPGEFPASNEIFLAHVHPDDRAGVRSALETAIADGSKLAREFRYLWPNGEEHWLQSFGRATYDAQGRPVRFVGISHDITERKCAEAALRDSEERFRLLFDGAADAILWADAETGVLLNCNQAAEKLIGWTRSELIGKSQAFVHPPEEAARYREMFRAHASQETVGPIEVEILRKDGVRVAVSISPSVTTINGRRVLQGIFCDITERKRAEQAILKSASFRETIIRTAAEGICVCFAVPDAPYIRFSVWNERMVELTGYTLEEINQLGWYQTMYPDPELRQKAQDRMARMRDGDDIRAEVWEITRRDGARRTVAISTSLVDLESGESGVVALIQDVTESLRAAQALQASEERYHLIADLAGSFSYQATLSADHHSEFQWISGKFLEVTGYRPEELSGSGWFSLIPPEDLPALRQKVAGLSEVSSAGGQALEIRIRHRSGELRWIRSVVHVVRSRLPGDALTIYGSALDITERKQADEALRRSEARYRQLVENAPFSIHELDSDGRFESMNASGARMLEFTDAERILGTSYLAAVAESDRPRVTELLHGAKEGKASSFEFRAVNGRIVSSNFVPLPDGKIMGITLDITERRRSEERFSKLFYASPFSIIVATYPDGKITEANDAFLRLFEFEREEVIGKTTGELNIWVDAAARTAMVDSLQRHESARDMEILFRTKSGGLLTLLMSVEIIHYEGQSHSLAMSIDISERKAAERTLRLTQFSIDRAVDSMFWISPSGEILYVNDAACRTLGYAEDELVGRTVPEIDPNFPADAWSAHWEELKQRRSFTFESDHVTKSGRIISTEVTANYLFYEGREYNCAVMRDITDRKRNEEALRASETRLSAMVSNAPGVAIQWYDRDGRVVLWNPASETMFGISSDEAIGKTLDQLFLTPQEYQAFLASFEELRRTDHPVGSSENTFRRRNGERGVCLSTLFRIPGPDENDWFVRMDVDITERKRAENVIQQIIEAIAPTTGEEFFKALVNHLSRACGVEVAYAGAVDEENPNLIHSIAASRRGTLIDNFTYDLRQTPCEHVIKRTMCHYATGVQAEFPKDAMLGELGIDSYLGIPLYSSRGKPLGILVLLHTAPMEQAEQAKVVLPVVAARASAELERRRAEAELLESKSFLQQVVDSSPSMIYVVDGEGRISFVNQYAAQYYGSTPERIMARATQSVHRDPREAEAFIRDDAEVIRSRRTIARDEINTEPNGVRHWFHTVKVPLVRPDGRVEVLGISTDITERKEAEAALRESQERLRLAVQATNLGPWDWDVLTGKVEFSPEWKRQLGYADDEFPGRYEEWEKRLHPEDRARVLSVMGDYMAGRIPEYALEFRLRHRDGGYRWIYSKGVAHRDPDGNPLRMIGCHLDITDRKRLEEQLRQSQKMQAIGQLAGGVAHDFNNLLTVILGYSELLITELRGAPRSATAAVAAIRDAGERAAKLTQQLLAFSRTQLLEPRVLNLNEVLSRSEKMLRRLIGEDVMIAMDLAPDLKPVKVDPGQIEQVIFNLSINARDAMPQGGRLAIETRDIDFDKTSNPPGCDPGSYVRLTVSDTGCGMSEEVISRIFEPFFTTKEQGRGTGLGLATVYGIVKQSEGVITVDSKIGQGTTFTIYLPAHRVDADARPGDKDPPAPSIGRETILLVEDEDAVRTLTKQILEKAGYTVIEAAGGMEAIRVFEEFGGSIDLLLTDVVMPHFGGRELAERLTHIRPRLKVLYVSGYAADEVLRYGVSQAETAFLQKPYSPDALTHRVREVLDS